MGVNGGCGGRVLMVGVVGGVNGGCSGHVLMVGVVGVC